MAELKTKPTKASATAFIKTVKDKQKRDDSLALLRIFKEVTGFKPVMWGAGIVGFGSYHYKSARSTQEGDWPLTGFAPRASGITIYIMPGFDEYGDLLQKLGPHKVSGGSCLYIKKLEKLHLPTLKTLIKKSVAKMKRDYGV